MEVCYLKPETVIDINRQQIEIYTPKERHHLRDIGALESALMRGQTLRYYKPESDIFEIVSAISVGLNLAHSFENGNKRTAMHVAILLLIYKKFLLKVNIEEAIDMCVKIASHETDEKHFADFLRDNSAPFDPSSL